MCYTTQAHNLGSILGKGNVLHTLSTLYLIKKGSAKAFPRKFQRKRKFSYDQAGKIWRRGFLRYTPFLLHAGTYTYDSLYCIVLCSAEMDRYNVERVQKKFHTF